MRARCIYTTNNKTEIIQKQTGKSKRRHANEERFSCQSLQQLLKLKKKQSGECCDNSSKILLLTSAGSLCVEPPIPRLAQRVRTSTGQRSFAVFGPATWNSLPPSLRAPELSLSTFKRLLKTQLFQHA